MLCCDLSPRVVPSPEGERWCGLMKFVAAGHLLLAVLYFFGGATVIVAGIMQLIAAWILFIAFRTLDYCGTTIYICLVLIDILRCFVSVGLALQFQSEYFDRSKDKPTSYLTRVYILVVTCLTFVFYLIGVFVAYRAYKEFKALAMGGFGTTFDNEGVAAEPEEANGEDRREVRGA